MRSLMFHDPALTPFQELPECRAGRTETYKTIRKDGRLYRMVIRDKVIVEDPYLVAVKAQAFGIRTNTEVTMETVPRSVRDALIRSNVGVI